MKISIITPNLNCGQYLQEALESVFCQGYESIEHIVLDGGSTDNSIQILREWTKEIAREKSEDGRQRAEDDLPEAALMKSEEEKPEDREQGTEDRRNSNTTESTSEGSATSVDGTYSFRWMSGKDKGQTDAINKGFRMASGDIRTWLNADEFYYSGTLRAVADKFKNALDMDVLYGEAMLTREDGSPLRVRHVHKPDRNVLLYYGCYITSVATFYNGRIFDDGVFLDDSYRVTMDFEFYARLWSKEYKFAYIPRIIGSFRLTGDNVSIRLAGLRRKERLQVQKKYGFPRSREWGLPTAVLDLLAIIFRLKSVVLRFSRQMGRTPEKIT